MSKWILLPVEFKGIWISPEKTLNKLCGYLYIIWVNFILFPLLLYGLTKLEKEKKMAFVIPLFFAALWIEKIKTRIIEGVKCEICGAKIRCNEHGIRHIKNIWDSFGNPVYYCEKCVIKYHTVFGAIVHMHNPFEEYANEFDEAIKEFLNEQAKHE